MTKSKQNQHLRILGCVSSSAFASLVDIPIGVASTAVGLKICVINARIKKLKTMIKYYCQQKE